MIYHIIPSIFRVTIIENLKVQNYFILMLLKKELINRTVLSDFKLVCSTAMILFIVRKHKFQIVSHHSLDLCHGCGYEILCMCMCPPPPVLCHTIARGSNSEWCLLLCGHVVYIRETFQVLVGKLHNFNLTLWIYITKCWNNFKILSHFQQLYWIYVC